ncbi:MAG: (2Fe-2S) ferredoxin domain-containing protein [Candidatus Gastranaerophilales bacterium]|nr:(2Fe-2S) ferredoxin domain-containing protein [Candidatus Gastranaerophilales bacterium]
MANEIKICMGSSCFARGNCENLEFIEKYIKDNNLDAEIEVFGARCENICEKGPNIVINGTIYNNVTNDKIVEELRKLNE